MTGIEPHQRAKRTGFRWLLFRGIVLALVDAGAWAIALAVTTIGRLEFNPSLVDRGRVAMVALVAIGLQWIWGLVSGLYPGRFKLGSFQEAGITGAGTAGISLILIVWMALTRESRPIPISVAVAGPALFAMLALGARFVVRLSREMRARSDHARAHRALVFGAGEAGHEVTTALARDPDADLLVVGLLDDDPRTHRLRVGGARVLGDRTALDAAVRATHADTMVIAMPSAPRAEVAAVARLAHQAGLRTLIVPPLARMLSATVDPTMLRTISFSDFLGRDPVRLDMREMQGLITGKRVLVTGAGGSIGSSLCAVISGFRPDSLVMLDRDENALHGTQLRLEGRAMLDTDRLVIADIRDLPRLHEVFARFSPEIVFHAAALKHVPFLEHHPTEAVKTNVIGTANVLSAAASSGVDRFVNISTDKAADPVNVLGMTKRIGEMFTAWYADNGMNTVSVRFGNVLGSSGSVIPTFRDQIQRGGPVTITHPDVTRYFMTIEEAAYLVVNAGAISAGGEVMVLHMGEPVRIVDLARSLIDELAPGSDIEVVFTGLRAGEKLHEVLVGSGDHPSPGAQHEGISRYAVPALSPILIEGLDPDDASTLRGWLVEVIDTYSHPLRTTRDLA